MRRFGLVIAAGLLLAAFAPVPPQSGGVSVAPMMVVLDTRGRPVGFDVINFGSRTETFRLDPLHAVIDADGVQQFEPADAQEGSAVEFLRWAPRQFEIQPGATRTIRLSARPPENLPPGEYRVHLRVTNIGPAPDRPSTSADRTVGANINIQVAQAVRVLVRHGVGPGTAQLGDLDVRAVDAGPQLRFSVINNHDGGSVLGRYAVVAAGADGSERVIREADITLYPDTDRRPVSLDLTPRELPPDARACVRFWSGRGGGAPQQVCSAPVGIRAQAPGGAGHANRIAAGN